MSLSKEEVRKENDYLEKTTNEINNQLQELGNQIHVKEEQLTEFKRYLWEEKGSMDDIELKTGLMSSELDASLMLQKMEYYKKLFKTQNNPYFGRIDFNEKNDSIIKVYIGLTYLNKGLDYLIYDWRSPIASMFYDYGIGKAMYEAPAGDIEGDITLRRQYKIENKKLIRIFDNDLNVVDECLQDVLSDQSNDKMKNIVNTIQQEQNKIIRNIVDKNLIVQGIAGSGKTSVALHRIAFLLYKIKNLKSSNVLIFSPNNVFMEYISNVLPELGEDNALISTFHDFAKTYIKEVKKVQSFSNFIEEYYTNKVVDKKLIEFKLSNKIIKVIENYVKQIENNIYFTDNIETSIDMVEKEYLDYLIKDKYSKLPLFERIDKIAEHLCNKVGLSISKYKREYISQIKKLLSIKKDFIKIYQDMYVSSSFIKEYKQATKVKINKDQMNYEDSLCFIYLKGLLNGFPYSSDIKQIVVDEAQDYNELQYIILKKIFKQASFTILGDINQTINPYQKYDTLEVLTNILGENSNYIELNKTYRSSNEIIEYTNKILNLKHVSAMRKPNLVPVKLRNNNYNIIEDINELRSKYKSVAIITKDKQESINLFNKIKNDIKDISVMDDGNKEFNRNLVIVPSYLAKGLEFDAVISFNEINNLYTSNEKYLFYVVCTRTQHELIVYNPPLSL